VHILSRTYQSRRGCFGAEPVGVSSGARGAQIYEKIAWYCVPELPEPTGTMKISNDPNCSHEKR